MQTRTNGEFKLRLEHANIRKVHKKVDDDQIIKFQERSPGLAK